MTQGLGDTARLGEGLGDVAFLTGLHTKVIDLWFGFSTSRDGFFHQQTSSVLTCVWQFQLPQQQIGHAYVDTSVAPGYKLPFCFVLFLSFLLRNAIPPFSACDTLVNFPPPTCLSPNCCPRCMCFWDRLRQPHVSPPRARPTTAHGAQFWFFRPVVSFKVGALFVKKWKLGNINLLIDSVFIKYPNP